MSELVYVPREEFDRLRALPIATPRRIELFADACRLNVLYMIAKAGSGHIGSCFSAIDLMSCLSLEVLQGQHGDLARSQDVFFSSKGHDSPARYAVLLALGALEFELLHKLRRHGGLPGHPDVSLPYMYTNTGSLGMGIAKARGMALARRRRGAQGHIYVLTGDGELQEGQFWESLQPTCNQGLGTITLIVDHNKIQSDTWVDRVSPLGELEAKLIAFGWQVVRCNGHDVESLLRVLPPAAELARQPRCIIADTIKGRGVSFMAGTAFGSDERLYRFHSGAPAAPDYQAAVMELTQRIDAQLRALDRPALRLCPVNGNAVVSPARQERLVVAYGAALVEAARERSEIVVLDGDLAKDTGLLPFEEAFPDRFFECGIAEQDMVSQAGGMALEGLLPIVHSFACFLSARPNEQIFNNATERTKIIYVGSLAGLLPGGPGHSHQAVRDIAALTGIPGLVLIEPSCAEETRAAVHYAVTSLTSVYLRLVSIPCTIPFSLPIGHRLVPGQGTTLREGKDVVLIGYGPVLLSEAWRAADLLEEIGVSVCVVNLPWLNTLDRGWCYERVRPFRTVITLDNHGVAGGQGQFLLAELARMRGLNGQRRASFGVEGIAVCGANDEVLAAHGLDAASLARRVVELLS